ncbi:MAG: type IV pilus biogenesis/stability protein PilW [Gammaproteobacteria bacterium]
MIGTQVLKALPLTVLVMVLASCSKAVVRDSDYTPAQLADVNMKLGVAYMEEGRYDVALNKLQKAVEADANFAAAHSMLGVLYNRMGKMDAAEEHYRRSVDLDPQDSLALNNYGQFLCQKGKTAEGIKMFLQALEDPAYASSEAAYTNAGTCSLLAKDPKQAETYFRKALRVNPGVAVALYQMADLSFKKKEYLAARGYLQRYQEVAPHDAQSLWLGIRVERELGNQDAEASYALSLRSKFPDSQETRLLGDPR